MSSEEKKKSEAKTPAPDEVRFTIVRVSGPAEAVVKSLKGLNFDMGQPTDWLETHVIFPGFPEDN